jgi:hypothetical protein
MKYGHHSLSFVLPALLFFQPCLSAESGPQPPCGIEPAPAAPLLNAPASVKSWSKLVFGHDWSPPSCTGWSAAGFTTLVTVVARFHHDPDMGSMLREIGAVSRLAGMRYWSTTHQQWRILITEAHSLTDPVTRQRRGDFRPDELKTGAILHFEQEDNLSGKATYRLHVAEASAGRIVFEALVQTPDELG